MENEKYFHNICEHCVQLLLRFYKFREDCFKAHIKFEKVYKSKNSFQDKKESLYLIKTNEDSNIYNSSNALIDIEVHTDNDTIINKDSVKDNVQVIKESINNDTGVIQEKNEFDDRSISENIEINYKKGALKFSCTQCKKVFQSKYGLNEHIKIHSGTEKSKCDICGKQFTRYTTII